MFPQLEALLKKGDTVSLTIAKENDTQLRVNVFPKLFTLDGERGDNRAALNQPLSVVGTAAELESEFTGALEQFSASITTLRTNLDDVDAEHKKAAEAAKGKIKPKESPKPAAAPKKEPEKKESKPAPQTDNLLEGIAEAPAPEAATSTPAAEATAATGQEGHPG